MISKTFKNFLIATLILLFIILFALTYSLLSTHRARAADTSCQINYACTEDTKTSEEKPTYVASLANNETEDVYNSNQSSAEILKAGVLNNEDTGNKEPMFPFWALSFAALPILLLWVVIGVRKGNLRRETRKAMLKEQIEYFGLRRKNGKIKARASLFTAEEVEERIKQNKEKKKEERIRLHKRINQF